MKVLLQYDNFIRDYRGLLLLKALLDEMGHKVWLRATWNKPLKFAELIDIDVLVVGQIAENATFRAGEFAKMNNVRLVINSTENVTVPEKFELFITYNTTQLNDEIIDFQTIATKDLYQYIVEHPKIKTENKGKYKYLGFPRLDLTLTKSLRSIEHNIFRKKYKLPEGGRVFLFISSFLLEGAFKGVPQKDLDKWNYSEFITRTDELLQLTTQILKRLVNETFKEGDVLLIKKHPWDCSDYFDITFNSFNCKVLSNADYILSCITNSDFILHTYSTAAIEAWILGKATISINSEKYKDSYLLNHMVNELTISSYEELDRLIKNYPETNPSVASLDIFNPHLDGLATFRLASEIHNLKPHPDKRVFNYRLRSKWKARFKYWLYDKGFMKFEMDKVQRNTKSYDFYQWENERSSVNKIYTPYFREYARKILSKKLL